MVSTFRKVTKGIHDQDDEIPNVEDEVVVKLESNFKDITTKEMEECKVSENLKCSGVNAI